MNPGDLVPFDVAPLDLALRSAAVLALGLFAREVLLRRRSPALRHLVLAACVLAAPAVAPLGGLLPAIRVALPIADPGAATPATGLSGGGPVAPAAIVANAPSTSALPTARPGIAEVGVAVWAGGFVMCLGWLIAGCLRLARLTRRARPVTGGVWTDAVAALGGGRHVRVLAVPDHRVLATWGWRRAVLLVPEASLAWPADRVRCVVAHELAHVVRQDWLVHLLASGVRAALWWNPLAWLACKALREDAERACDDAVLDAGADAPGYATHLLAVARDCQQPAPAAAAAMPMARPSSLHRRIAAMLNPTLDRARPSRAASLAAITAIVLAVVVPAAVVRTEPATPRPEAAVDASTGAFSPRAAVMPAQDRVEPDATVDRPGRVGLDTIAPDGDAPTRPVPGSPAPEAGFAAVPVARAQGATQRLEGVVYDPTGAVLPGVEVKLTQDQTVLETTTDASGRFAFESIAPGNYTLEASVPGFRKLTDSFLLAVDRDWNRAITLQVGTLKETISIQATRLPQPATGTAPAVPTPVRVGGNIRAPRKVHSVNPTYPDTMVREGREAVVPLEARIDTEGRVASARVVSAQVHPDFAAAAIAAMQQWRFEPTLLNGQPVEVLIEVSMSFSLK